MRNLQATAPGIVPTEESKAICEIIEVMRSINTNSPEAELNATSISDNNDGRIIL